MRTYSVAIAARAPPSRIQTAMYVCICNAVSDREIRGAVKLGARTMDDLSSLLGVGTCCGKCTDCAKSVLHEALDSTVACAGDD